MVSIPDWAKFAQISENKQQDKQALLSKFYKQREAEAVRQAEQSGYFLNPTLEVIQSHCGSLNPKSKVDVDDIKLVRLDGVHLRVLGDIGACTRLTICLLANNYLTKIDALVACRHLIKLDLHSNQLSSLPAPVFWSSLRKLQSLHLHDNPLGKFETLQILGSAPALTILTLFDTPLSLKKNYRHHVVNSIWSLKALDHHVISDEEIIEDAVFSRRFTALSPPFRIDLCPQTQQNFTFDQEMSVLRAVNARLSAIMARHSPVLIVQRCLRGYLLRRKLGIVKKMSPMKMMLPPPGTPIMLGDHVHTMIGGQTVDYDTYMQNRRPGSIVPEEALKGLKLTQEPAQTAEVKDSHTPAPPLAPRLQVNLEKLESGTLSGLQADTVAMETVMAEKEGLGVSTPGRKDRQKKKENKDEKVKPKRIKEIKQFFGPVVDTHTAEEEEEDVSGDEIPMTDFRLKGTKPKLLVADATTEMILSRKEAGHMVREAEAERMKQDSLQTPPKATPHNLTTTEQRFFSRAQGTMGLSCLMAVHKAYREREKAEKAAARMENILGMREERQRAKDRINMYHDERRAQVLKTRDMDRARVIDRMEKHELNRLNFLDKQQEHKVRASDGNKAFRADHTFMLEFNSQHTSVSNALLRHDRQARADDVRSQKENVVSNAKVTEVEQQNTVKKYLEHRQLMKQTETAMAKAALDTKMLSEANERMMEARSRVAHLKARRARIQAFYPVQASTLPPSNTAPAGMSRWEAQSAISGGRVGRHNTIYT
ncbi:uncharacterized protein LOC101845313 [Aplysia californica]|uniref:Uncharacterized protein LOC101845313 n=1 Tax=Aplysia californica TaxID=6500 RepID=A0ABM0JJR1_APLCA|nr:uncharacterized protein LOC101845313 [Aplysia californica]